MYVAPMVPDTALLKKYVHLRDVGDLARVLSPVSTVVSWRPWLAVRGRLSKFNDFNILRAGSKADS
jgi:hypothetical protein